MSTDAEAAPLSSPEIEASLQTQILGRSLRLYDTVESTNQTALGLAASGAASGTIVLAEAQVAGRGRMRRAWHSPPRANLYCSILLRPSLPPTLVSTWLCWLPLVTGVGILKAIKQVTGIDALLKWPNDILIKTRKVAGILCESSGSGTSGISVVVGIGINVNMNRNEFPDELAGMATSLACEAGRRFSRNTLVATLLNDLESRIGMITSDTSQPVLQEYASLCATIGREVQVTLATGEILKGLARSLTADGALSVIQAGTSQPRLVYAGDVVHVR